MRREPTPLQAAMIDYISNASCNFDTSVNLTFAIEPDNRNQAIRNFTWFIKNLNDTCYGNNWHRRAKHRPDAQLPVVPMLEDGYGYKRLHYHCVMTKPEALKDWQFEALIIDQWAASRLGGKSRNKVEPFYFREGVADYICKEMGSSNTDIIDIRNMHIY